MGDLNLEIKTSRFVYNHLTYTVGVSSHDQTVWWEVLMPIVDRREGRMLKEGWWEAEACKDPQGAVLWAHKSARRWIDDYVRTQRVLQETVEETRTLYGGVEVE